MQSIFIMMRNHLTFLGECYDTLSSNSFFIGFGVFKRTYRDFQMALLQLKTLNLLCKRYLYDFTFCLITLLKMMLVSRFIINEYETIKSHNKCFNFSFLTHFVWAIKMHLFLIFIFFNHKIVLLLRFQIR
jgi:hypothetical protein